jgi:hypothetical protein
VKGLVAVQHDLDEVIAARHGGQMRRRPAEVERHGLSWRHAIHIHSEEVGRIERLVGLDMRTRFARQIMAQQQDDPAVERRTAQRPWEGYGEGRGAGRAFRGAARR